MAANDAIIAVARIIFMNFIVLSPSQAGIVLKYMNRPMKNIVSIIPSITLSSATKPPRQQI